MSPGSIGASGARLDRGSGSTPRRDDHRTLRLVALGAGLDVGVVLEAEMDDLALGRRHRLEDELAMRALDLLRGPFGYRIERDLTAVAVALGIDDDLAASVRVTVDHYRGEVLQRVERLAVTADQQAEVGPGDVGHDGIAGLRHLDIDVKSHARSDPSDEVVEPLQSLVGGDDVAADRFGRSRQHARLDARLRSAHAQQAALAALVDDHELDVVLAHIGHHLAELLERLLLGCLDGDRAGHGGKLGLVGLLVRRWAYALVHRSLHSVDWGACRSTASRPCPSVPRRAASAPVG